MSQLLYNETDGSVITIEEGMVKRVDHPLRPRSSGQLPPVTTNEKPLGIPTMNFGNDDSEMSHVPSPQAFPIAKGEGPTPPTPSFAGAAAPAPVDNDSKGTETALGIPVMNFDNERSVS